MLIQAEADRLLAMNKRRVSGKTYEFPMAGESLTIPIVSVDESESFLLDVNRGTIRLTKCTYQERYQGIIILVRLDVDGPPHTNPEVSEVPLSYLSGFNGTTIPCPHLHLYVEHFMDKWAIPAPTDRFPRTEDIYATLNDFFRYCHIIEKPIVQKGLFV